MSKSTNAPPDNALPGGNPGPLLWYDQPSTAIEDLDMTDNATPKPLSDYGRAKAVAAECRSFLYMHEEPGFPPPNAAWCIGASRALHEASALIEKMLALQAQPAPVPLAEDEAVIADLEYIAQDEIVPGVPGIYARKMLAASNRLSLRSGQLAQVLALCERNKLILKGQHGQPLGDFGCVSVVELKSVVEGEK